MVSVYRKIMTMQIKNGLCLLWLFVLMLLFAARSDAAVCRLFSSAEG